MLVLKLAFYDPATKTTTTKRCSISYECQFGEVETDGEPFMAIADSTFAKPKIIPLVNAAAYLVAPEEMTYHTIQHMAKDDNAPAGFVV
ncbi:hypothetical protein BOW89_gp140 [Escherichia phage WG01]|uniref:Uncharacterized protein n=1 Tax=Escherichia phage WG01 TaxID=1837931 RepID=A0A172Q1B6_9CAUD|nr:hypothetical protein BOW89_gp140 [Escherichia phage WG01]AND75812.1 hypothetical protein WG01_140 [Escherichia phage WG01]